MYTIEKEAEEIIENYLKSKKIAFTKDIQGEEDLYPFYTLMVGSEESYIQLELSEEKDCEFICCSFFIDNQNQNLYYNSPYETINDKEGIECEIDSLIDATKNYVKGIAKVKSKIEEIKDMCEYYNINIGVAIDMLEEYND